MMMARKTNVPTLVEVEIVNTIAHWCDLISAVMTSEAARQITEHNILHLGRVDTRAFDSRLDRMTCEGCRRRIIESSTIGATDRRAGGGNYDC